MRKIIVYAITERGEGKVYKIGEFPDDEIEGYEIPIHLFDHETLIRFEIERESEKDE